MPAPSLTIAQSDATALIDIAQPDDLYVAPLQKYEVYSVYNESTYFTSFYIRDIATGVEKKAFAGESVFFSGNSKNENFFYFVSEVEVDYDEYYSYVYDVQQAKLTSVWTGPNNSSRTSYSVSGSADGKLLAFISQESGKEVIYLKNMTDGSVKILANTSHYSTSSYEQGMAQISADGTKVVYTTKVTDPSGDPDINMWNVFLIDVATGETTKISQTADGGAANGDSRYARFSDDGTYVIFNSDATNLLATPDGNAHTYKFDLYADERLRFEAATDGSSISFDAGDGSDVSVVDTTTSPQAVFSHLYAADGNYAAELFAKATDGSQTTTDIKVFIRADSTSAVTVTGTAGVDMMVLSRFGDTASGGDNDDVLKGAGGNDTLAGGVGNDTLDGGSGDDNAIGGDGNDVLMGAGGKDTLSGSAGNDRLDGGTGDDTLIGGAGDDTYMVNSAADSVLEASDGGQDTVLSNAYSYTLATNVETLTLSGPKAFNGTGNQQNNTLIGNNRGNILSGLGGDDYLVGGLGADRLIGGAGNDTYILDDSGQDVVVEEANDGIDTVHVTRNYTLGTNVENLVVLNTFGITGWGNAAANTITGDIGNDTLSGLDGNDRLEAGDGNDRLIGGRGFDTLIGGNGDDTYVFEPGDTIVETAGGGFDTIEASVSASVTANIEAIRLIGSAAINATGDSGNNTLWGNSGQNILRGLDGNDTLYGTGNDRLEGGRGNDVYTVEKTTDTIIEAVGEGTDTVVSTVTLTLAANVENLVLSGTRGISGTGNAGDNTITGNSVGNTLNGGDGNDTLIGGNGDDLLKGGYGIDRLVGGSGNDSYGYTAGDVIVEELGGGIDTVISTVEVTLPLRVENVSLIGRSHVGAVGNGDANVLTGNVGNNYLRGLGGNDTLSGGDGNDTLAGGTGRDILEGGAGADTFLYRAVADGGDTIIDFVAGTDRISISSSGFGLDLSPRQLGAHMLVVGSGAEANRAYAQFLYDPDLQILSFDADGNGSGAAVQIASAITVSASDIYLF